jgi:Leucine Rich repeat
MRDTRGAPIEVLQAGITYIAQVLKRNRTLKVLNLSENKLEVAGLVAIAEALVRLHTLYGLPR